MGNFLESDQEALGSCKNLSLFLKKKTLHDVNELLEYLQETHATKQSFNQEEFEDIFGMIFDDFTEAAFLALSKTSEEQLAAQRQPLVDLYEALSVIILLNGDEWDERVKFIFKLFDFDASGDIDQGEFILSCQAVIRSLCKIVALTPPPTHALEKFARQIFFRADSDGSGTLSLEEVASYLESNYALQNFFLKYAHELFQKIYKDLKYCELQNLQNIIHREYSHIDQQDLKFFLKVLEDTSKFYDPATPPGHTTKEAYDEVINSWCAFEACDLDASKTIDIHELRYMLYCYDGVKPNVWRVQTEHKAMDKDGTGHITNKQWMEYLCVANSGLNVFRTEARKLFTTYDSDQNGNVDQEKLKLLIQETMAVYNKKVTNERRHSISNNTINATCAELLTALENNQLQRMTWNDFKNFMNICYHSKEQFKQFTKFLIDAQKK